LKYLLDCSGIWLSLYVTKPAQSLSLHMIDYIIDYIDYIIDYIDYIIDYIGYIIDYIGYIIDYIIDYILDLLTI